jgi:hypothetical protein
MGMPTNAALPLAYNEPRTRTALLLESIALRHQIAVLERSGTRRPCFRLWDRLFWILFSRWWYQWRDSLIIVQPETVLRWRRDGWSALWRYRSRGRWRGGRPRISNEVRHLIVQGWPGRTFSGVRRHATQYRPHAAVRGSAYANGSPVLSLPLNQHRGDRAAEAIALGLDDRTDVLPKETGRHRLCLLVTQRRGLPGRGIHVGLMFMLNPFRKSCQVLFAPDWHECCCPHRRGVDQECEGDTFCSPGTGEPRLQRIEP